MKIKFVDLFAQYESIKAEMDKAISQVISDSAYIGGKLVKDFEAAYSSWMGGGEVVSCANGTDSIEILLKAWEIGPGDEVIVPALTWISTAEAVNNVGATPVFAKVDPSTFTIDAVDAGKKITARTKAIIPVHLYGQCSDMEAIKKLADLHKLLILEDCAQAHGALHNGKKAGTMGDAASFSFYPGKNLGAYGDAGCMFTKDVAFASRARMIANHGQLTKHDHRMIGRNSRLDGLQAGVLNVKLKYIDTWNEKRIEIASKYTERISNKWISLPVTARGNHHVFHLYILRSKHRNQLMDYLLKNGIEAAIHYPTPLPYLKCYAEGQNLDEFTNEKMICDEILSLPIYPEISKEQLDYIVEVINKFNPDEN
jgi:dTDP-4-amino-4,6-dideoxygalactose transaminase